MTIEELKSEAKKLGYKLIKDTRPPKLLPCICGCKRRNQWYDSAFGVTILSCERCWLTASGKNRTEAIIAWNSLVKGEENDMS